MDNDGDELICEGHDDSKRSQNGKEASESNPLLLVGWSAFNSAFFAASQCKPQENRIPQYQQPQSTGLRGSNRKSALCLFLIDMNDSCLKWVEVQKDREWVA